jgi:hypothetical protein
MTVLVGGRPVVMLGMIVVDVLVDVQRRGQRRPHRQTTREHGCDQTAHGQSLLRGGARPAWRRGGRELFYIAAGGSMMAVPVTSEMRPEHGAVPAGLSSHC